MKYLPIKRLAKKMLNIIGVDVIRYISPYEQGLGMHQHLGFELEDEAVACINIVRPYTMLSKSRLVTLYQQVAYCERYEVPGVFVECGVWKGGSVGLMALANLQKGNARRHLHLFDAFSEICEPDAAVDGKRAVREVQEFTGKVGQDRGLLKPVSGFYDSFGGPGTLDGNRSLLEQTIQYPGEMIHYHVGWFQETLPAVHDSIGQIAILRLDGDWYASTKVCLDYLFKKVARGGIVIIDDYGAYDGCRRAVDEFLTQEGVHAYLASVDSECRFFVKL
jgi:O-methyltransferase